MKQQKNLPTGIQTFAKIRDPKLDFVYVDKTKEAYHLAKNHGYFFLSRPRRFGKSLFLDTLSEIFKGSKSLFEGLFIYDKWDWEEKNPVIRIDFSAGNFNSAENIKKTLIYNLKTNAEALGIAQESYDPDVTGLHFINLIRNTHEKYGRKVVILIDEYDKPILDNIVNKEMASVARELLRNFYSAIKSSDAHLRFLFITGVSKFSKLNLFSGLNNLDDITIDERFATITGYTHSDLQTVFADRLEGVDLEEMKRWYNGYNYFGEPVYNPFDVLLFLSKGNEYKNYWWETGNPKFLIDLLKEKSYFLPDLQHISVNETALSAFDVERIELPALLWQTGYLTFDRKETRINRISYTMKVPNLEVQMSLNALFFEYLAQAGPGAELHRNRLLDAMLDIHPQMLEQEFKALFAAIPYNNYVNNTIAHFEGYYASVIYAFMSSLGFSVRAEETTNRGRIDMALIGPDQIFLLEFKVDMPAEEALHQIKTKRYFDKYTAQGKPIYLIGIHFDSAERNLAGFVWEEYMDPYRRS